MRLYSVHESADEKIQNIHRSCMSTLGHIDWLGNQKTGRFAVLLCESSSSCPLLITLNANRHEVPFLQNHRAPHLNETKYRTYRLPAKQFLDTDVSKTLLTHFLPGCTEEQAKLIIFCVGINPREYSTLTEAIHEEKQVFSVYFIMAVVWIWLTPNNLNFEINYW